MKTRSESFDGVLRWAPLVACSMILAVKIPLLWRINVNWDEFYFLSHVFARARGDLAILFQTAYTNLFLWLTWVRGGEVTQIVAARGVMLALLALTCLLLWRLAGRWTSPAGAAVAPLAYLAASPVLRHGASFRADSLLVPLTVGILLLFTNRTAGPRASLAAGVCFGVALALTVKAVLLAPLLLLLAYLDPGIADGTWRSRLRAATPRLLLFGVVALGIAGLILVLHRLCLSGDSIENTGQFAARATRTTLLRVPLFPRADFFEVTARADPLTWLLIGMGAIASLVQRRYAVAVLGLALLPLAFYRNAFPYYYVVMLAPACVLAAVGADTVLALVRRTLDYAAAQRILLAVVIALSLQAATHLFELRDDDQARQRLTIAAIHQVFPQPVPYIDHSGMVASFPKANFFMSSWGVADYRARGTSFMRAAMTRSRPPLLLVNRGILDSQSEQFRHELFAEDQQLIERFYLPYWGPIHVAGAQMKLVGEEAAVVELPFPGRYRLDVSQPVMVGGVLHRGGDVIEVATDSRVVVRAAPGYPESADVRFYWAAAAAAPSYAPPAMDLYVGL